MYRKNTASQAIGFCAVNASTGAAMTGTTGFAAFRVLDGGAQAAATGTVTDKTNGQYSFALSQADTNGNDCSILFTMTGMVPVEKTFLTTVLDPTSAAFGLVLAKTTNITGFNDIAATAIVSGGAITTSSGAVSSVTTTATATNLTNTPTAGDFTATQKASITAAVPTSAAVAIQVEQQIMDETDTRQVLAAIVAKINATDTDLAGLSIAAIAAAVWDELKASHTISGSFGSFLDAVISSRLATSGYTAPPSDYQQRGVAVTLPAGQIAMVTGAVVSGSTGSAVVVSGLPSAKSYAGQRLYHAPSGEARTIATQSFASGNYTFNFTGQDETEAGPFSSVSAGDVVAPVA